MDNFYIAVFLVGAVIAAVLEYGNRLGKVVTATDPTFRKFKLNYLVVYSFMMGAQGCRRG